MAASRIAGGKQLTKSLRALATQVFGGDRLQLSPALCARVTPVPLGRKGIELFAKVAQERRAGVLVVTQDARILAVFDRIRNVEDGAIRVRAPDNLDRLSIGPAGPARVAFR